MQTVKFLVYLFLFLNVIRMNSYSVIKGTIKTDKINCGSDININGENEIIKKIIDKSSSPMVFDVGANKGDWSLAVLRHNQAAIIQAFEPIPSMAAFYCKNIARKNVTLNAIALSDINGIQQFFVCDKDKGLSSLYDRPLYFYDKVLSKTKIEVETITLDSFCKVNNIYRIDFLKIDTEGAEWKILNGSKKMLSENKISFIQFEYGGTYLDAKTTLKEVFDLLTSSGYSLYRITGKALIREDEWRPAMENYKYSNYLASIINLN